MKTEYRNYGNKKGTEVTIKITLENSGKESETNSMT